MRRTERWGAGLALAMGAGTASAQVDSLTAGLGATRGEVGAAVHVVEFADFGCGYCAQFAGETFPSIERDFIKTGRIRWTFVPFVLGAFPNSDQAAHAGECAAEQAALWPMHDRLFAERKEWTRAGKPRELFVGYARGLGLDTARFRRCIGSELIRDRVRQSGRVAKRLHLRATPTFFIDGKMFEGALYYDNFKTLLQRALAARGREGGQGSER